MAKAKAKPARVLEVVYRKVSDLQPDPDNARVHPPSQIEELRKSLRIFKGFTKPLLLKADSRTIGVGNGTFEAAKLEGIDTVPTITVGDLTPAEWKAYAIADNRLPLNATWDSEVLLREMTSLQNDGFDLDVMGFSNLELGGFGVQGYELEDRLAKADETPALPKATVVALGQLWILGEHRVLCGDSTKAEDVTRVLAGAKPHLMVTDPPYGVNYDANWRNEAMRSDGTPFAGRAIGKVENDDRADWAPAWKLFTGDVAYVWHAGLHAGTVSGSLKTVGFEMRSQIIWAKGRFAIGRGDYHYQHEPCWYAVRKGKKGHWAGDRKQTTLWEISHNKSETGHSTQKPIECMRRPILNNSKPGDAVYEPFAGSGTTLIAAEMEGRRCFAIELSPQYVEVIIRRWESFADKTAKREDGKTLAQLEAVPKSPAARKKKVARK